MESEAILEPLTKEGIATNSVSVKPIIRRFVLIVPQVYFITRYVKKEKALTHARAFLGVCEKLAVFLGVCSSCSKCFKVGFNHIGTLATK